MKRLLCTMWILLVFQLLSVAQNEKTTNVVGNSYVTRTVAPIQVYDPLAKSLVKGAKFLLHENTKFYITEVLDEGYVISLWIFKNEEEKKTSFYKTLYEASMSQQKLLSENLSNTEDYYKISKTQAGMQFDRVSDKNSALYGLGHLAYVDSWGNNMHFFISLKDFNDKCDFIYPKVNSFTWGFLTLPIKARFNTGNAPFIFEEQINFGIAFGLKFQRPKTVYTAHNILSGLSVTRVKFNRDSSSAAALSLSFGYMFQRDKFQVGIFSGWDFVGNKPEVNWPYHKKPWIGFAIGVSLFGENKTEVGNDQHQ